MPEYGGRRARNAMRVMYAEEQVARHLLRARRAAGHADVAVVINADYYLPWDVNVSDVRRAARRRGTVYASG